MPGGLRGMHGLWLALERSGFRRFSVSLTALALAGFTAVFAGFSLRSRHLLQSEMVTRARSELASIMLIRSWNVGHGGVWVEKRPGGESAPSPGVRELQTTDGKVLVFRGHAAMMRELADLSGQNRATRIGLTSLKPSAPANRPTPREREALLTLERGSKEQYWTEKRDGRTAFTYMGRLLVEPSCLPCHASQEVRVGDVRGAVTLTFDCETAVRRMSTDLLVTVGAGCMVFLALVFPTTALVKRLRAQVKTLRRQLEGVATTDALTGLANRRYLMERFAEELDRHQRLQRSLGCIMLDIDHFKEVNDSYGHLVGDQVLRRTAAAARQAVRPYDLLARYGGEELVVLLPEANLDLAWQIAQRLRELVATHVWASGNGHPQRRVTVSAGVTCSTQEDDVEAVLARADQALYRAKEYGRNRVETQS